MRPALSAAALALPLTLSLASTGCRSKKPPIVDDPAPILPQAPPSAAPRAEVAPTATATTATKKGLKGTEDFLPVPAFRDQVHDPEASACTTTATLRAFDAPDDLVWEPCGQWGELVGCQKLAPRFGALRSVSVDPEAPGGSILALQMGPDLALFTDVSGRIKHAVQVRRNKAICSIEGVVAGGGRYALDVRADFVDPKRTAEQNAFGWVTAGSDYQAGGPAQLATFFPQRLEARLGVVQGRAREWPLADGAKLGTEGEMLPAGKEVAVTQGAALAIRNDGTALLAQGAGGSESVVVEAPRGSIFSRLVAGGGWATWLERPEGSYGCVLVAAAFAGTGAKLSPQRLGAVPCSGDGGVFVGEGYAVFGSTVVSLADGKTLSLDRLCSTAPCNVGAVGIASREVLVFRNGVLLRIPIGSLSPGQPLPSLEGADAGAPAQGDAGALPNDAGALATDASAPVSADAGQ